MRTTAHEAAQISSTWCSCTDQLHMVQQLQQKMYRRTQGCAHLHSIKFMHDVCGIVACHGNTNNYYFKEHFRATSSRCAVFPLSYHLTPAHMPRDISLDVTSADNLDIGLWNWIEPELKTTTANTTANADTYQHNRLVAHEQCSLETNQSTLIIFNETANDNHYLLSQKGKQKENDSKQCIHK